MQGQIRLVNGFVVKILKHYMLSDKTFWHMSGTGYHDRGQVESRP
ncbi:hypothetical protein ACVWZ9_004312 [Pseudomonas chlororaphis]